MRARTLFLLGLIGLVGCDGVIGEPGESLRDRGGDPPPTIGPNGCEADLAPQELHRLSSDQYLNMLADLFPGSLGADAGASDDSGMRSANTVLRASRRF